MAGCEKFEGKKEKEKTKIKKIIIYFVLGFLDIFHTFFSILFKHRKIYIYILSFCFSPSKLFNQIKSPLDNNSRKCF